MSKIMVQKYTDDLKWQIDGELLKDVLATVNGWIATYGEDSSLSIDTESEPYSYCEYARVKVVVRRLETDEEYENRIGKDELAKRQQEQRERAEYERLKAKFGE